MNKELQHLINFAKDTTVVVGVVFFSLGMTLASMAGRLGWPLFLLLLAMYSLYMFVILERSALGHKKPPVLGPEVLMGFDLRPFLAVLLIVLFVAVYNATLSMGYGISSLVAVTAIAVLPAMISILAISGNFLEAFNPLNIIKFITGMKLAYVKALVALVLTGLMISNLIALDIPEIPTWFLFFYALILVFRYLGFMIYLKRDELGLAVEKAPELETAKMESLALSENKRLMDHIFAYSNTGHYEKAYLEVMEYSHKAKSPHKTLTWFVQRCLEWDNKEVGLRLAQWLVSDLLDQKKAKEAWLMYEQAIMANPKFRVRNTNEAFVIAQYAKHLGKKRLALEVLAPFIDENTPQTLSPAALKLAIQIAAEGLNDLSEAKRLILIARTLGGLDTATINYFKQIEGLSL